MKRSKRTTDVSDTRKPAATPRNRAALLAELLNLLIAAYTEIVLAAHDMRAYLADTERRERDDAAFFTLLTSRFATKWNPEEAVLSALGTVWYTEAVATWLHKGDGDTLARLRRRVRCVVQGERPPEQERAVEPPGRDDPGPPDDALVDRLCDSTLLTLRQAAVIRAEFTLLQADRTHKPRLADIAALAGCASAASVKTLRSQARRKLRARGRPAT